MTATKRTLVLFAVLMALSEATFADPTAFPSGFRTEEIASNGTTIHVRVGGSGPDRKSVV